MKIIILDRDGVINQDSDKYVKNADEFYKILEANNIQYEVACTLVLLATNQY